MKRLNETGTPVEKMLLLSGKDDAPAPGARERAMLSMGLSGAPPAGKAQGISPGIKIIQWIGQILLYGALAALSGALIFSDNTLNSNPKEKISNSKNEQSIDNSSNAIKIAESENAEAPKPGPSSESTPPNAPRTQNTPNTQNAPKIPPPKRARPETPNSALKEEIELVDAARKALRNDKNPRAALNALKRYQSRFPKGVLRGEAQTLLRELNNNYPQSPD
jgi:hypothetical protein